MCRISPLLFMVMVVAEVVECASSRPATTANHAIDQHEILLAITINQMALLQGMNASSSVCASRESELRELRMMNEEVKSDLEELKQEVTGQLQALVREMVETEIKEAVRNASLVQPSQQPTQQPSQQPSQQPTQQPDLPDLDALHNDTNPSLCGLHKVLYGSRGSLSLSHSQQYQNFMACIWRVVLPEGTRPIFTWEDFSLERCDGCRCDFVLVYSPGAAESPRMCGDNIPTGHPMYDIVDNEFLVVFTSDHYAAGRGFVLHYTAERV